ncbi:MAG: hypothetical protein OEN23_13865 [Paracoccaceae bacterium]|nr:hypothetical protein [Paracoccaceae bacterium]
MTETACPAGVVTDGAETDPEQVEQHSKNSRNGHDLQAGLRAVKAALRVLADPRDLARILPRDLARIHPLDLAWIQSRRFTLEQNELLARSSLGALRRADTEAVCEEMLGLVRFGEPIPPLFSYRDEARTWAFFASPAERRAYMAAIWDQLDDNDRRCFLKRAL